MKQAMVFAAGLGTRLKPLTNHIPKALVEIGGKPLLQYVLEKLHDAAFERVVINVHHFPEQIIKWLNNHDNYAMDICVSCEEAEPLETGGGIRKAFPLFDSDSPILIHNVDVMSNANFNDLWEQAQGNDATLLVSRRQTKRYLLFDDNMLLRGWTNIETKALKSPIEGLLVENCSMLAFSGIHVISPSLFSPLAVAPERFSIIDFYLHYCATMKFRGIDMENLQMLDCGKPDALAKAEQMLSENLFNPYYNSYVVE